MNFAELEAEVYLITNRPDLATFTKSAIKAATLKAHRSDFFSKDIHETGVAFDTLSFRQSLDYITLIPNFIALKYIRKATDATDDVGKFLSIIEPEEVIDSYGYNRSDVAYTAGRVIEMRSSTEFQYILLGCYVLPIVTESGYASWVAEQFPYTIIHEAARRVFRVTGQLEEAKGQEDLITEEYFELSMAAVPTTGS